MRPGGGIDGSNRPGASDAARARLVERLETMARTVARSRADFDLGPVDTLVREAHALLTTAMPMPNPRSGSAARVLKGGLAGWQFRIVAGYVDDHVGERLTPRDLARCVGLSTGHFARAFRQSFGCTPMRYVRDVRLERAKTLMLETDLSLREIALGCGFSDQAHFTRRFHAATAGSPRRWRCAVNPTGYRPPDVSPNGLSSGRELPGLAVLSPAAPVGEAGQSDSNSP